jgi:hypothetical protein
VIRSTKITTNRHSTAILAQMTPPTVSSSEFADLPNIARRIRIRPIIKGTDGKSLSDLFIFVIFFANVEAARPDTGGADTIAG